MSSEHDLRKAIRAIYADANLSATEKQKKVQDLHLAGYRSRVDEERERKIDALKEVQQEPEYNDAAREILGCRHYQRKCKLVAKCCGLMFVCRLCHDDEQDHKIDRFATEEMMCMKCKTRQPVGQVCANEACGETLARYYCSVCKFWEDKASSEVYHCDKCGLCRRGKGLGIDFQHCDSCNACLSVGTFNDHRCLQGVLMSNCPICHEWMQNSVNPVTFLPCGHPMHAKCYRSFARNAFQCPTCLKSVADMSSQYEIIQSYVDSIEIPETYRDWTVFILCNDCLVKSTVPYKFAYHKCTSCDSFNTDILKIHKPE